MQDFSRFVPNVHFEQIPIKNLVSNQEYQRPLSQAQVEKAIEDFDLCLRQWPLVFLIRYEIFDRDLLEVDIRNKSAEVLH